MKWSKSFNNSTSHRTQIGRVRAWLRLALMQKKLADYFKCLVEETPEFSEYYDGQALLRSEEAAIVCGLLVSLNVVDCNICVKEEDLDSQQGVVDFSLYLRGKRDSAVVAAEDATDDGSDSSERMSTVLNQKNYVEELNRHLTTTVTNLEAKVENLTTTNCLMKEDLSICKDELTKTRVENRNLLVQLQASMAVYGPHANATNGKEEKSKPSPEVGKATSAAHNSIMAQLAEAVSQKEKLEKELRLQVDFHVQFDEKQYFH